MSTLSVSRIHDPKTCFKIAHLDQVGRRIVPLLPLIVGFALRADRQKLTERIVQKLEGARSDFTDANAAEKLSALAQKIFPLAPQFVTEYYRPYFSSEWAQANPNHALERAIEDIRYLQEPMPRVIAPQSGLCGPTLLIHDELSFVMKWSGPNELASNLVMGTIANRVRGFFVPMVVGIDQENGVFLNSDLQRDVISTEMLASIKTSYSAIAKQFYAGRALPPHTSCLDERLKKPWLLASERLYGGGLSEFVIQGGFEALPPEHLRSFFRSLGKLVLTDLVFGSWDRLVKPHYDGSSYSLLCEGEVLPANPDNVMLVREGTKYVPYAIDQEMFPEMIDEEPDARRVLVNAYRVFLRGLLSQKDMPEQIYRTAVRALQQALNECETTVPPDTWQPRVEQFVTILANEDAREAFTGGILAMHERIRDNFIPYWNDNALLQDRVKQFCPALFEAFASFLEVVRKPS